MKWIIRTKNLGKRYKLANGKSVSALKNITFELKEGEFASFIGPSGCGKTTFIKLLAGLIQPTEGRIWRNEDKQQRSFPRIGVVFQNYNLFPWLTVRQNIGFGFDLSKTPLQKTKKIISHYIEVVGLKGFENSYPKELSGGMQQRVALARALAINPQILLLDEPFAALDVQTKRFMQDLLLQLWEKERKAIVFVTHDVEEAVFMSDTLYVMSTPPGTIREKKQINLPRPRDLKTEFSDDFIKIKKEVQKIITKESLSLAKLNLDIYKDL